MGSPAPVIDVTFLPGIAGTPAWAPLVLAPDELARWTSLHDTGRPLFLAAHVAVRLLAVRRTIWPAVGEADAPPVEAFGWDTLPSGKPRLTFRDGRPQPLHISIAHSAGLAAAAVSGEGPIGIDIERDERRRDLVAIAGRFFAPEEQAALAAASPRRRPRLFHQWWTRKEAVLKATGAGLPGGLTLRVDGDPDGEGWRPVTVTGREAPLFVRDLPLPEPGVYAAIAIDGRPGAVRRVEVDVMRAIEEREV